MARQPAARHRRGRRFTPRRWLPFAALTAIVVGAVMVSTEEAPAPATSSAATTTSDRMPAVTPADAIATAWYCSGGTATGDGGTAELSVVLANDSGRGASAEVTFVDEEGNTATEPLEVPAHGRARLAASSVQESAWTSALVEVRGGRVAVDREVRAPLGFDASPCSIEASDHWYVPSGSTLRGAEEYLSIFNPFPDSASVNISFATNSGRRTPRDLRALSIPGRSVRVVKVSDTITNRSEIAATVFARSGRVVVDRLQTYDGGGDPLGGGSDAQSDPTPAPEGLVSTAGIPVRAPRWIFPAARYAPGVRTQIAVYNPGSKTAEVDVALNVQEPERNPTVEPVGLTLRPREQVIVDLAEVPGVLPSTDYWVDVRSLDGVPIVAERLSYFGEPSPRTGAAVTAGSPIAATDWLVTQGGATRQRTTTVQVVNPNSSDTKVTVIVLSGGDRKVLPGASFTLPAGDRRSIDLEGAGSAASVIVHTGRPVVVSSSIALLSGTGISVQPAFPFPETAVALPPVS